MATDMTLDAAKRALQKADYDQSTRDDFSIEEFSEKAIENLSAAMDKVREEAGKTKH